MQIIGKFDATLLVADIKYQLDRLQEDITNENDVFAKWDIGAIKDKLNELKKLIEEHS